jgi:hypothetical protein
MEYEIRREGRSEVEKIVEGDDPADALNTFADYLERHDVAAFWHRDASGIDYVLADDERYYAHPRMQRTRTTKVAS